MSRLTALNPCRQGRYRPILYHSSLQHYTVLVGASSFLSLLSGVFFEIQLVIDTISCARSSHFFTGKGECAKLFAAGIDLIFFFFAGRNRFWLTFGVFWICSTKKLHHEVFTTSKTWVTLECHRCKELMSWCNNCATCWPHAWSHGRVLIFSLFWFVWNVCSHFSHFLKVISKKYWTKYFYFTDFIKKMYIKKKSSYVKNIYCLFQNIHLVFKKCSSCIEKMFIVYFGNFVTVNKYVHHMFQKLDNAPRIVTEIYSN